MDFARCGLIVKSVWGRCDSEFTQIGYAEFDYVFHKKDRKKERKQQRKKATKEDRKNDTNRQTNKQRKTKQRNKQRRNIDT